MDRNQITEIQNVLPFQFGQPDIFISTPNLDKLPVLNVGTSVWKGTPGVKGVAIRIEGINPLTGARIPSDFGLITVMQRKISHMVDFLNGTYTIHLDAVCMDGTGISDVIPPHEITIRSPKARPFIRWRSEKESSGWFSFMLETNCVNRISGKLWLFGPVCQKLPEFTGQALSCHLPFDPAACELKVLSSQDIKISKF